MDADCCSRCCCVFSASGIVFLVSNAFAFAPSYTSWFWPDPARRRSSPRPPHTAFLFVLSQVLIGTLLKTEPLYIQNVDDPTEAASNCFMAAGIYSLFVVCTTICIMKSDRRQRDLSGVMDGNETIGIKDNFGGSYGR